MDPAVREAYIRAYESAARRHGALNAFSAVPTAVRPTYSTAKAVGGAEMRALVTLRLFLLLLVSVLFAIIEFVWFYIILPILAFYLFRLFLVILYRIITLQGLKELLIDVKRRIAEAIGGIVNKINEKVTDLRFNDFTDAAYLKCQRTVIWIGNNKLKIICAFLIIWCASGMIGSQKENETEKFMTWPELQRHLDRPLPEYLLRQRNEYGSNSHYRRDLYEPIEHDEVYGGEVEDEEISQVVLVSEDIISAETTVQSEHQTLAVAFEAPDDVERIRTIVGESEVWCRDCQQFHCCEVPY